MIIINEKGRPIKAIFKMAYQGHEILFSQTGLPGVCVIEKGDDRVLGSFYGEHAITDAMSFINRGCTSMAA